MIADLERFALRLAEMARRETLARANGCEVEDKNEGGTFDPVTEADRAAERVMRSLIERDYPDHGIVGEEFGPKPSTSRYRWILDPIDGTRSFTCGLPTWVTLISLLEDDLPILGVIDAPRLGETYLGSSDGARLHAGGTMTPLQASRCQTLSHARLSTTDPYLFAGTAAEAFGQLRSLARTVRYGHDGYAYARLAAGTIDLVVETGLKEHDYQALIPVVRAAGGVFGDWRGGDNYSPGNVIAAATPQLFEAALAIMGSAA